MNIILGNDGIGKIGIEICRDVRSYVSTKQKE